MPLQKLDFEKLYNEAASESRIGICNSCEEERVLCWCGVCFKYCHNDYFHEELSWSIYDEGCKDPNCDRYRPRKI